MQADSPLPINYWLPVELATKRRDKYTKTFCDLLCLFVADRDLHFFSRSTFLAIGCVLVVRDAMLSNDHAL